MLTIAKVNQRQAAGYAEYLEGRSQPSELGDYYLKDGDRVEAPGRWVRGAAEFGLDPERAISGDELRALMAVRRPDTGQELRRAGGSGEAVAAIDATFSAPKSVSAVWAVASSQLREEIERAHEEAIDRALTYSLAVVAMVRERLDQEKVIHAKAKELIATSWRHTTARAIEGQAPDPQLHSHVLLHGAIRPDGKVVAIDSRSWLIHRRELGAAYRTELAHELARLGFQIGRGIGRGGRYFELQGVPRELLQRWSSRHQQIRQAIGQRLADRRHQLERMLAGGGEDANEAAQRLEALAHANQLTPREDRLLTTATRTPKQQLRTRVDLDREWSATATVLRFDRRSAERLRSFGAHPAQASERELRRRLTEFDATFTEREARAVALEASTGVPIEQCLAQLTPLRASGGVLALAAGQLTTREHRAAERRTIATATSLANRDARRLPAELVEGQAVALDRELSAVGGSLSDEQREAIRLASSQRQLVMIEGHAGSGKSTTLQAIANAHQAAGRQIVVTSTAALAAERLATELRAAGVDADAYSTLALELANTSGRLVLGGHTTVIHEEAALASTREQQRLLAAVDASGARLILLGDPRQSQAVGAGGLWPYLKQEAKASGGHVELTRNVRALDAHDRAAQRLFRDGEHERAVDSYAHRGRVRLAEQQRQAEDQALEAAQADREAGKHTLVIAQTSNEHLDELNARAQAIRTERGELGQPGIEVIGRPYNLRAGDEIQIRHTLPHPQLDQLRNGTTGHVIAIDAERELVMLRLADHRDVILERKQIDEADIRLAYIQHPFLAQGQTTHTAHLLVAEHATAEGSYVAVTRAREATHIHASRETLELEELREDLQKLAEHMGRSEPEVPSIHYPLAHEQLIGAEQARQLESNEPRQAGTAHDRSPEAARARQSDDRVSDRIDFEVLYPTTARAYAPDVTDQTAIRRRAASTIARYRTRYAIGGTDRALDHSEASAGSFQQRYQRREAAAEVLEAVAELDPAIDRDRELQERALEMLGLDRASDMAERSVGWEP